MSWKRAGGIAALAVYGPFLGMAAYTLAFVSCSHCKVTAWQLFAWAPGLLPVEMGRRCLDLPRLPDGWWFAAALAVSVGMVAGVAVLVRAGGPWKFWGVGLTLAICTVLAVGLLGVIRV